MITDRDPKILSSFWTVFFKKLGVELFYPTAYHHQTDGSSERTNQIVEIALRFLLHTTAEPQNWPLLLPRIQTLLNNATSTTTGQTLNKLAYEFDSIRPLNLLGELAAPPYLEARSAANDAILFAAMANKKHNDKSHQSLFLKVNEFAFLKLHKSYSISLTLGITKKLTQQYISPYRVMERVGRLVYLLDILSDWQIHPVFFVAQLEPAADSAVDLFQRKYPDHPPPIFVDGDTDTMQLYEVERLLNRRVVKKGRGTSVQYLVCWKEYASEYNRWYSVKDLDNASDLVRVYEDALRAPSQRGR